MSAPYRDNANAADVDDAYREGLHRGRQLGLEEADHDARVNWVVGTAAFATLVGLAIDTLGHLWGAW